MARQAFRFITYNDLIFMINNEGIAQRNSFTGSNYFIRKDDLQDAIFANNQPLDALSNNEYVTYEKVQTGIYADENNPINVPFTAGSTDITVVAPNGWEISDNASWLTFSPASGLIGQEVTASYTLNTLTTTRTAVVTLSDPVTLQTYVFDLIQAANPGVATDPVSLGFDDSTSAAACADTPSTYYIPEGETFMMATDLFANTEGTILAPSGFYSAGGQWRQWNGTAFIGSGLCV